MFALVDCNNFYASCERVFNPRLNGKPIVVLSNNDDCIIARSDEAKAVGIEMGQPYFMARPLIEAHGVHVFSSNYALYGDMSCRVMQVLYQFTPDIEIYSIDEAFLKLSFHTTCDFLTRAREIRQTVRQYLGIPISIGVAPTKTLAKVANQLAKKQAAHEGVFVLETQTQQAEALARTDVEAIWGIGRRYAPKLRSMGIATAADLARQSLPWAAKYLGGVVGVRLLYELQGISCMDVGALPPASRSVVCTRSFGREVTTLDELSEAIATYTTWAAEKLRRRNVLAWCVSVFIQTSRFGGQPFTGSQTIALPVATHDTGELIGYAVAGLKSVFRAGYAYKKAGVVFSELLPATAVQMHAFDGRNREKSHALMQTMDCLNRKMGAGTVRFAALGTGQPWKMRSEKCSPRYTTRWTDLMRVLAQ